MPATAALADSVQMPEGASDLANEWSDLHFRTPINSPPRSHWRPAAALAVALLHIALLNGLLRHRVHGPAAQGQRIEVSFIERVAAPVPIKEAPHVPRTEHTPKAARTREPKSKSTLQAIEVAPQESAPLRLQLATDEWQQPATPLERNPQTRGTNPHLPGRTEPFVEGVRFNPPTSPEKVLRLISQKLFGGIDPDPCPAARERLANLESDRDRHAIEADLRALERYCKP